MEFRTLQGREQRHVLAQSGEGPDVVLLHGFPDTPYSWRELEPALVASGRRVSIPWLRGYHPDTIVPGRPCDPQTLGRDALSLLDAIGAERAVLVGHDWGALLAYAAATIAPERISAIVTIAIPHPSVLKRTPAAFWAARHFIALKMPWATRSCARDHFAYFDRLYRRWSPNWSGAEREQSINEAKRALSSQATLNGALDYYRQLPLQPTAMFEHAPDVAALIIGGTVDLVPPEYFTQTASLMPAPSRALVIDRAGHWVHREHADRVIPELVDFVVQARS